MAFITGDPAKAWHSESASHGANVLSFKTSHVRGGEYSRRGEKQKVYNQHE